jgi:hypothetical protein
MREVAIMEQARIEKEKQSAQYQQKQNGRPNSGGKVCNKFTHEKGV